MRNRKTKVELQQAFLWVCDECGRDNFERSRTVERGSEEWNEVVKEFLDQTGCEFGEISTAPIAVKCGHCGTEFGVEKPS